MCPFIHYLFILGQFIDYIFDIISVGNNFFLLIKFNDLKVFSK